MLLTVYHKKAFVLKIPLHPPFPKGDNKDNSHIFIRFSPTHLHNEPLFKSFITDFRRVLIVTLI